MKILNKALVIDDHPLVARGIADFLRSNCQFDDVQIALNRHDFEIYIEQNPSPDLIVLDFWLSESESLHILDQLKQHPKTYILVISADDDWTVQKKAEALGAHGFLHKQEAPEVFSKAVEKILSGEFCFNRTNAKTEPRHTELVITPLELGLTPRQGQILSMVLKGLPNKRIAQQLSLSEQTVKEHITGILQRLKLQNRIELITFMRGKRLELE